MKKRIGIDLGGTFIKAGITDENNDIIVSGKTPTGLPCDSAVVIKNCADLIRKLLADAKVSIEDIEWIGMGIPGTVDCEKGVVEYANNLGFNDVHVREMLTDEFHIPVFLGNDANVAAYGEYKKCGEKCDSFVFITLGTGVGGGIIIDGKIYTGFNFAGAELGHIVIEKDGIPCTCGRKGCWESYSSVNALIRKAKEEMMLDKESLLWKLCKNDIDAVNGEVIFDAVKQGDKASGKAIDWYNGYLACGLTNIVNIFQPELLCIGGGVSAQKEYLVDPIREIVSNESYGNNKERQTQIRVAKLMNDAGIIGAAALGEIY